MIMNTWFEEEVSGSIIGAYTLIGQMTYQGRNQGQKLYAKTEEALRELANAYIQEKKDECGEAYSMIWPDKSAWKLKIHA